ncbi:MAG: signal recognition particle receptor subunit alpha, partial [Hydrogenoanaerobacterium sp.]
MGFFQKIKTGLEKTRSSMVKNIEGMLNSFTKIDEELFEELEEILISGDVGVATAAKVRTKLREKVKETGAVSSEEVKVLLKSI